MDILQRVVRKLVAGVIMYAVPPGGPAHMPIRSITLYCYTFGSSDDLFPVDIEVDKTVGHLRNAILKEQVAFTDANANPLAIWKLDEPMLVRPARDLPVRIGPICASLPDHAALLDEPTEMIATLFQGDISQQHLYIVVQVGVDITLTAQWLAMKSSDFYDTSGNKSNAPVAGGVLRAENSRTLLSMADSRPVSVMFIRECYIVWFGIFLVAATNDPNGKFALSSTPGCGKTTANNFIFKMAASEPLLRNRPILYQFEDAFYLIKFDYVHKVDRNTAQRIASNPDTFYVLDGHNVTPVHSTCLTLFISSPRSDTFKNWHTHAMIVPRYLPVWSLEELRSCHGLCYTSIRWEDVKRRYKQYGGVARYVFWTEEEPTPIEAVVADSDARKGIRSIGDLSQVFPTSHMLIHIFVDETLHFQHVVLASRYVGTQLFLKYFDETFEFMQSLLGGRGALAGHLFECYVHFLFENGYEEPLTCRSLQDDELLTLTLPPRKVIAFDSLPTDLSEDNYYVPMAANFPAIDSLIKDAALQHSVTPIHAIKGVQVVRQLQKLYPSNTLPLVFMVPESIAADFTMQPIVTSKGGKPENVPTVRQFVVGLPLGINPRKRKRGDRRGAASESD